MSYPARGGEWLSINQQDPHPQSRKIWAEGNAFLTFMEVRHPYRECKETSGLATGYLVNQSKKANVGAEEGTAGSGGPLTGGWCGSEEQFGPHRHPLHIIWQLQSQNQRGACGRK